MISLYAFLSNRVEGNIILKQKSHRKNSIAKITASIVKLSQFYYEFKDGCCLTSTWVQVWVHVSARSLTGHQLVLEGRDPAADVGGRSCLHEEGALRQSEAAH